MKELSVDLSHYTRNLSRAIYYAQTKPVTIDDPIICHVSDCHQIRRQKENFSKRQTWLELVPCILDIDTAAGPLVLSVYFSCIGLREERRKGKKEFRNAYVC